MSELGPGDEFLEADDASTFDVVASGLGDMAEGAWNGIGDVLDGASDVVGGLADGMSDLVEDESANAESFGNELAPSQTEVMTGDASVAPAPVPDIGGAIAQAAQDPAHADEILAEQGAAYAGEGYAAAAAEFDGNEASPLDGMTAQEASEQASTMLAAKHQAAMTTINNIR